LSSLFVFSPFFFETRLRRDDDDDICDDSKAYKEYQKWQHGSILAVNWRSGLFD
jgi:hypothetical protein